MLYPENTQNLLELIERFAAFASSSVSRASTEFGVPWQNDFETILACMYASPAALEAAVKGYRSFAIDSMRRQKRFELDRVYPAKTFEQASQEVYMNDKYMTEQYLPGLLLSHYLWIHHYQQIRYFREFFIPTVRIDSCTDFAEIGVGTGIYSRVMLEELPEIRGVGFDISPLSLTFAERHVASYGFGSRYEVLMQDIITKPPVRRFQSVICVEVLEHLEDPVALLKGLKSMVAPGGKLFVTAALNAAHADHIYLYRNPQDVLDQVADSGLHIENLFFANAYVPEKPGVPVPAALAMILSVGN